MTDQQSLKREFKIQADLNHKLMTNSRALNLAKAARRGKDYQMFSNKLIKT